MKHPCYNSAKCKAELGTIIETALERIITFPCGGQLRFPKESGSAY